MLYIDNTDFSALITAEVSSIIAKSKATISTQDLLGPITRVIEEEIQEQVDKNGDGAGSDVTLSSKRKSTLFALYAKHRLRT